MGVYTPQQFVGKLGELNVAVGRSPRVGITAASQAVKESVLAITPARLSGVGKRGAKLGVRYWITGSDDDVKSVVHASGPFQLIERDTKAHQIPREGGRKVRYAVIKAYGDDAVFSRVEHPGTHGKHPFERGSVAAIPTVRRIFGETTSTAVRGVFL